MPLDGLRTEQLVLAVQTFLSRAYAGVEVPANRKHWQEVSAEQPLDDLLAFEKGVEELPARLDVNPGGYALRLGNAWYPNMKLVVQAYGAPPGYVFGVDTHDMFKLPAGAPDAEQVRELRKRNQELARAIESDFEKLELPTQNGLLRAYLTKRDAPTSEKRSNQ